MSRPILSALGLGALLSVNAGLVVETAPNTPQPYVLPNLKGTAVDFGGLIVRTLVANATSEGAMSIINANSAPTELTVIHSHAESEAFYNLKGSLQVFHNEKQGRELLANDFGLLAAGNNHTFRTTDLDWQVALGMAPGGIDGFFAATADPYNSSSPFNPEDTTQLNITKVLTEMPKYHLFPAPNNTINLDFTNGTTADGLGTWHKADQSLPSDANTPYFISSNRGPKYLRRDSGIVIAQLASGTQTNGKLGVATIVLKPGTESSEVTFDVHQAFQVTEGQLQLQVGGESAQLIFGDLAFIPKGTSFKYWSTVGFTKVLAWSAGNGLADSLIDGAEEWDHAVWPVS